MLRTMSRAWKWGALTGVTICAMAVVPAWAGHSTPVVASTHVANVTVPATTTADKPPITDVREQGLIDAMAKIDPLTATAPEVVGEASWSTEDLTVTLRVTDLDAPVVQEIMGLELPVKVKFLRVAYSTKALTSAIDHLFATHDKWAKGVWPWGYAHADSDKGAIAIGVLESQLEGWREAVRSLDIDVPIVLVPEEHVGTVWEDKVTDANPWKGGTVILGQYYSGPHVGYVNQCTSGFNWQRWSGLGTAGSTANHCINDPTDSTTYMPWFNGYAQWGTPVRTSPSSDAALLQVSGATYQPKIFVGNGSNDLRNVVAAASSDVVGESVALSGAMSGGPVSTVWVTNTIDPNGIWITVMTDDVSVKGDSGGPWLKTYTNGTVLAKGQHMGKLWVSAAYRSIYSPVIKISAKVEASVLVTP